MFTAALLIIAKLREQSRCPTTDDGLRKCGIDTQWCFTQAERMKYYHLQVNQWNWRTSF
jgi:hypothetical protein